jgi:hypothetical protein
MPLIVFSGKELQASSLYCRIPEANVTPERTKKAPRNIAETDRELEKLLRNAVRLRNAQIRAARTKTDRIKGNSKEQ